MAHQWFLSPELVEALAALAYMITVGHPFLAYSVRKNQLRNSFVLSHETRYIII